MFSEPEYFMAALSWPIFATLLSQTDSSRAEFGEHHHHAIRAFTAPAGLP